MTRSEFLNYFKQHHSDDFKDNSNTFNYEYFLNEYDSNHSLSLLVINSKLDDIYQDLKIANGYYLKKGEVDFYFDDDYAEEYPDADQCRYTTRLKLNFLYDQLLNANSLPVPESISLYRIESVDGKGVYDGKGFNILSKGDEDNQPGPELEPKFLNIFSNDTSSDSQYKKEWLFAFSNEQQIKSWVTHESVLNELKEAGFLLKKIDINPNYVIQGDNQAIFKPSGIISSSSISLDIISNLFKINKAKKYHP